MYMEFNSNFIALISPVWEEEDYIEVYTTKIEGMIHSKYKTQNHSDCSGECTLVQIETVLFINYTLDF